MGNVIFLDALKETTFLFCFVENNKDFERKESFKAHFLCSLRVGKVRMLGNNAFTEKCNIPFSGSKYKKSPLHNLVICRYKVMHELFDKFVTQCDERLRQKK